MSLSESRRVEGAFNNIKFSAGAGDYEPLSSEAVLLTPTQRFRVCSDLVIRGDSDLEGDEEFEVVMSVTEQSIHTDGGNIARVTIIDDDCKYCISHENSYTDEKHCLYWQCCYIVSQRRWKPSGISRKH